MSKNQLVTSTAIITSFIAWNLFGESISSWIYLSLTKIGLPIPIIQLILLILPPILLLEIVTKLLFVKVAMPPLKFVPTQPESWQHLDQDQLIRYTFELEQLGFVKLTDYTSPSIQGMARLFAHPQKFCFAEVGQLVNLPMFCIISCHLEKQWLLGVTNMSSNPNLSAISYAFLRQPRNLGKHFEKASANFLFQSLLNWREQVSSDLDLKFVQDIKAETYFEKVRSNRIELMTKYLTPQLLILADVQQ